MFSFITWSLPRKAFTIPWIELDIWWYGVFWALGFYGAYHCFCFLSPHLIKDASGQEIRKIADRLLTYIIMGVIIGARLGHYFFYESIQKTLENPLILLNLREGGFASHGGIVGTLIALILFYKKYSYSYCSWLDLFFPCSMFLATCLRLGNSFNQEILGTPSTVPWAFIFTSPLDGSMPEPRHPAQLYEALFYFLCFITLCYVYKKWRTTPGLITGSALLAVFSFRFFIEFVKEDFSVILFQLNTGLNMGQWLSIPFIFVGALLLKSAKKNHNQLNKKYYP